MATYMRGVPIIQIPTSTMELSFKKDILAAMLREGRRGGRVERGMWGEIGDGKDRERERGWKRARTGGRE